MPSQSIRLVSSEQQDCLLNLAEQLSEREGIPIEVAYSIVCRHYHEEEGSYDERQAAA